MYRLVKGPLESTATMEAVKKEIDSEVEKDSDVQNEERSHEISAECGSSDCPIATTPSLSTPPCKNVAEKTRHRMNLGEYEKILEYIENPENFAAFHGSGRKTKIGGKHVTKTAAFGIMAVHLAAGGGFRQLTGLKLRKKYERYVERYKKAREFQNSTGAGLSQSDMDAGLTMEDKLNKMCPHFFRMHALFGCRANVDPPSLVPTGFPEADDGFQPSFDSHPCTVNLETNHLDGEDNEVEEIFHDSGEKEFSDKTEELPFGSFARVDVLEGIDIDMAEEDQSPPSEDIEYSSREEQQIPETVDRDFSSRKEQSTAARRENGKTKKVDGTARLPPVNKQTDLVTLYHHNLQQKFEHRKASLESKENYRKARLEDKKRAREESKLDDLRRAKMDRRTSVIIELSKAGKSVDEIKAMLELLNSIEGGVEK